MPEDKKSQIYSVLGLPASGKGTLAAVAAHRLGYHYLDSGALYRLTAFAASRAESSRKGFRVVRSTDYDRGVS